MKKLMSPWWAIITLGLLIAIRVADPSFVESVRLRYFDQLITSKGTTQSEQIYVVNIDDAYIKQTGQFPFPRGEYAKLIENLYLHGAGLVVFNVYLADADRFNQDSFLTSILRKYPVVLPHAATSDVVESKHLPFRPGVSVIGGDSTDVGVRYGSIDPIIKQFNQTAAGIGVINTLPEIDGVTRRIPLFVNAGGQLFPSIGMETLRVASGDPSFQVKINDYGIEAVRIPQFGKIPVDNMGRIWIDWSRAPIEYSAGRLPENFNGGIVIVGLTAKGLNNPVATSIGSVYPHYVQAAVLDTLVSGTNINRPDYMDGLEILTLLLLGLTLIALSRWTYVGLAFTLIVIIAIVPSTSLVFSQFSTLADATILLGGLILTALHCYGIKFVSEFLQKQQIKKQFGTYLSPALVEKLQKNPGLLKLGGESRELSIMFTDVRGFTTISEHYGKDVQGLTQIMNRYMTAMTAKILENNGTLDKYIGDAQMAFWNAPVDESNHAKMAVKTALQMMESLDEFNREIEAEGVPAFGMGLGINTDVVVVGNMGSSQRFDYTCLGDGVNLASRLEGQSKPYGVKIVIGPRTAAQIEDEYPTVELDCIAVKGKTEGVKIFTIATTDKMTHRQYLEYYYRGDWIRAKKQCQKLIDMNNELKHYYENMLERMEEGLPANWDGTYRATSK